MSPVAWLLAALAITGSLPLALTARQAERLRIESGGCARTGAQRARDLDLALRTWLSV